MPAAHTAGSRLVHAGQSRPRPRHQGPGPGEECISGRKVVWSLVAFCPGGQGGGGGGSGEGVHLWGWWGWAWGGAEEEKLENPQFQQTVGPQFQQTQSLKTPTFGVYFFFPQVIFTLKKKCKKENKNIKLLPVSLRGNPYEQFAVYHC